MSRELIATETIQFTAPADLTQYAVMPVPGTQGFARVTNIIVPKNETFTNAVTFEIKVAGSWYPHKDLENKTADQNKANIYTTEDAMEHLRVKMVATVTGTAEVEWWGSRF